MLFKIITIFIIVGSKISCRSGIQSFKVHDVPKETEVLEVVDLIRKYYRLLSNYSEVQEHRHGLMKTKSCKYNKQTVFRIAINK